MTSDNTALEAAKRYNQRFIAFSSTYQTQNPPPQKPRYPISLWIQTVTILIVTLASIIVSGSRTIPEFGDGLIGWSAFIMLEIGLIVFSFFRTRMNSDTRKVEHSRRSAKIGIWLMFAILLSANIHNTFKSQEIELHPAINTVILIFVSISAPVLAFIAGDMLAIDTIRIEQYLRRLLTEYDQKMKDWSEGLNNAWDKNKSRWGGTIRIESDPIPSLSNGHSNGIPLGIPPSNGSLTGGSNGSLPVQFEAAASTAGHKKIPMASEIVRKYLLDHPEHLNKASQVIQETGVPKSTVYNVIAEIKAEMATAEEKIDLITETEVEKDEGHE
jgi:hypothetical protein